MKHRPTFIKALTGSLLMASALSVGAAATDIHGQRGQKGIHVAPVVHQEDVDPVPLYDPYSAEFRAHYPLKVFVNVEIGKNGNRDKLEYLAIETLARQLPYGVQLVQDPRYADLVIRAHERDFDANFRVVDIDREDKKYKKRIRRASHYTTGCSLYKAHYTRVKERGVGYYDYGVRIRMKGYGRDRTRVSGKVRESYSYGKDLKAQTSCGFQPVTVFPSNKVERLFAQSDPSYRREVRRELRREAACDLGLRLAHIIKARTDTYYVDLAYKLQGAGPQYGYNFQDSGHDYARSGGRYKRRY